MNSGTKRAGFAFHHHGQPMRSCWERAGRDPRTGWRASGLVRVRARVGVRAWVRVRVWVWA